MPRNNSQIASGSTRIITVLRSHQSNRMPRSAKKRIGPPISPSHAMRRGTSPRPVHEITENQPVPERNDEPGAQQERPVLEVLQRGRDIGRAGTVHAHGHEAEHEDDPDRDENGLDDSSRDVADRERFVLPPRDRIENDTRPDVREDEEELEQDREVEPAHPPVPADKPGRVVENGLEDEIRRNRREERDDEQHPEYPAVPLVVGHPRLPSSLSSRREGCQNSD